MTEDFYLTDTHCHLDDDHYREDLEAVIHRAQAAGIAFMLNPGCDEKSSQRAVDLSECFEPVYAAVGFHPSDCGSYDPMIHEKTIRGWAQKKKVLAIGEIGLDYYYDDGAPRALQKKVFESQIRLAGELKLPIIVHDRDAHGDCLDMVRACMNRESGGVFHSFSGSVEMARDLLDLGMYIALGGPLTFKNARKAPDVAAYVPADRLLIETDSPYLTPVPHRGKRNEPAYVAYVAAKMAEIRGVEEAVLRKQTYDNARRLFQF